MADDALSISAQAPVVPLPLRAPGRHSLRLPTLEYRFEIQVRCTANRSPESLSLSVADTRHSFAANEITANGATEFSLSIPAGQIPPVVIDGFCIARGDDNRDRETDSRDRITIPAALSAQAALLCGSEEDSAMTYVSRPLDVSLVCKRPAAEENSGDDRTLIDLP